MNFLSLNKYQNPLIPSSHSHTPLQWKKACQNLHHFIQNENIHHIKSFYSPNPKTNSVTKHKINQMKSLGPIHYTNRQTQRSPRDHSIQSKHSTKSILLQPRYIKNPQILSRSPINQTLSSQIKNNPQIGVQTFDQDPLFNKRDLNQQNKSLKQLIQILQTQILNYSKTITDMQAKITQLKNDVQSYTDKLHHQLLITNDAKEKLDKEIQLNKCMQYIISELNQKVSGLLSKNALLQDTIEDYKLKEQQNLADTFSESNSCLSINSENQKQYQYSQLFKNSDISTSNLVQSQILIEDKQTWSFSGLDMSCFSKTPNKVHQVQSLTWEQASPNSMTDFSPDHHQIDQIIDKHKTQISSLKEQLKYYQIENQMLRRKKQLTEKNTIEIQELKFRIQKLSQQNRMMQGETKKKPKVSPDFKSYSKNPQQQALLSYKEFDTTRTVMKKQKKFEDNAFALKKHKTDQNLKKLSAEEKQKTEKDGSPSKAKRKSPLHRKFMRRPSRSPRSSSNLDDDSSISLEFSPQRI